MTSHDAPVNESINNPLPDSGAAFDTRPPSYVPSPDALSTPLTKEKSEKENSDVGIFHDAVLPPYCGRDGEKTE